MAKFVYKMQNILDIKYKLESQAKTAYANANAKLRQEEQILVQIQNDINRYEEEIRQKSLNVIDIEELKWCANAIQIKKMDAEQQKKKIDRAKKEVELARIKLNEVMIDRKTHEKLKERAFDEFKQELSDTEAKEVDEIVSFNFNKSE
ncbi:MAG: flagellar export protein FliJ [Lachnospiraceae bacterium]|nr:flagellar export protein FliJ [Lachnospiraceae bacterium]